MATPAFQVMLARASMIWRLEVQDFSDLQGYDFRGQKD